MSIKTFEKKKQAKIDFAKKLIENFGEEEIGAKELKALKKIVKNSYEITAKEVNGIAMAVAEIKEVGLSPNNPVVATWAKKELGISCSELSEIIENVDTPEEAKLSILEKMDAPKEMIKKAKKDIYYVKKK